MHPSGHFARLSLGIKPQKSLQETGFATDLLSDDPQANLCARSFFFKRGGISKVSMRHCYNQSKSQMSKSPSRGHRCWSAGRSYDSEQSAAKLFAPSLGPECHTSVTGLSVTSTFVSYWTMWNKNCPSLPPPLTGWLLSTCFCAQYH